MPALPGVEFLQGDFNDEAVLEQLLAHLGPGQKVDLVMSDIAPNMRASPMSTTTGRCSWWNSHWTLPVGH